MTAKEKVKKLILYIKCRKSSEGYYPNSFLFDKAASLKRELLAEGVDKELLDMHWHDLEERVYNAISSQLNM